MSDPDALPPDQRASLQLLLKQGQSYDQLADLLGIGTEAVRDRAHSAVDKLGPSTSLPDSDRAAIADYLLGQEPPSGREAVRGLLAESADARAWAKGVAESLRPMAGADLPEIPAGEAEPEPAQEPKPEDEPAGYEAEPAESASRADRARESAERPSSRLGGALLLGGLGIIIAVVLILVINGGDDDGNKGSTLSTNPATQTGQQRPVAQVNLNSASGNRREVGLAQVFAQGNRRALIVAGQGLDPGAYALWLYNSRSDARLLGFVPERVGRDGRFATQGELPRDAEKFKQLILTRERVTSGTRTPPKQPGQIVLQGDLKLQG
jgi:Sigma-70, region 4